MKKTEQKITTEIKKYLQHFNKYGSCAIEVKQTPTRLLNYKSNIKDRWHQLVALQIVKHKRLLYKISDIDAMTAKPFDLFCLEGVPAFYMISFQYPKNKTVYMIDVDVMETEILLGNKKSLSIERAKEIAFDKIQIK